jgi:tetratricopeptide (TPR) repeat protein
VVFYLVDAEKGEGVDLAKTYHVTAYPTFLLMNAKGESIDRWLGYSNPQDWNQSFATAMADPTTVTEKEARFAAKPTAKDAALLARIAAASRDNQKALGLYQQARTLDPKGPDYAYPIFDQKVELYLAGKGDITLDQVKESAAQTLASPAVTIDDKVQLAQGMEAVARKAEDPTLMVPYVKEAVAATDGAAEQYKDARKTLLISNALYVEKDKQKALELKRKAMSEGWMEDPGKLNAFAWWCFENNVNLPEAEELARKGVTLAKPGKEKAQVLDTVAEICNALGDCKDAVTLTEQAIKEDPKNDYYAKQLARFQKAVAEKG